MTDAHARAHAGIQFYQQCYKCFVLELLKGKRGLRNTSGFESFAHAVGTAPLYFMYTCQCENTQDDSILQKDCSSLHSHHIHVYIYDRTWSGQFVCARHTSVHVFYCVVYCITGGTIREA